MILSGQEIMKQVKNKNIIIEPFEQKNINPNSYNYRLGHQYKIVSIDETLDYKNRSIDENNPLSYISEKGLLIEPGKIYLATTYEIIGSHKFVTLLIGRSSVGRLGLFLEISADLGNLGTAHKWTLEITSVQPVIIYPYMKIGQVSFWIPEGDMINYQGNYTNFNTPQNCFFESLF